MSEMKHEISAAMLKAAENAAIKYVASLNACGLEMIGSVLEAADVPALIAERDTCQSGQAIAEAALDDARRAIAVLTGDNANFLARITELEAALRSIGDEAESFGLVLKRAESKRPARIAKLEADLAQKRGR